ncbi:AAA family ATPase [Dyadobacter sp. 22481]
MKKIEAIRNKVFSYLYERYEATKMSRMPLLFVLDRSINFLQAGGIYASVENKEILTVLFYGEWKGSEITYLTIDEDGNTFLTGIFDGDRGSDPNIEKTGQALTSFYENVLQKDKTLELKDGLIKYGEVLYTYQFHGKNLFQQHIEYFLEKIKPQIDTIVHELRSTSPFYFFNEARFNEYLRSEPCHFSASVTKTKSNIRLKDLIVQNFRGIKQLSINNLPGNARWIVLTGVNGYGKTSVLQAIAAGLCGSVDENGRQLIPESAYVGVAYLDNGQVFEINSRLPSIEFSGHTLNSYVATYGSSRLQVSASTSNDDVTQQLPATYSIFNDDAVLLNIEQLLKDNYKRNRNFFDQIVSLFKKLIPSLSAIEIIPVGNLLQVFYFEKDSKNVASETGLRLKDIATGFKNILAMIGDLVYRLSIRQRVTSLTDLEGIVIIDEIELHLHPIYQKLLPEVLSTQFPKIQFIISTHSPIPLLGIPKDIVTLLMHVSQTSIDGVVLELLDIDFSVLTPNAILTSPIFGFQNLIPDSKPDDRLIQTEDDFVEIQKQDQINDSIKKFLTPENQQKLLDMIKD